MQDSDAPPTPPDTLLQGPIETPQTGSLPARHQHAILCVHKLFILSNNLVLLVVMQPIDKKLLESLIKEAKEAGKDTTELEAKLNESVDTAKPLLEEAAPMKMLKKGKMVILSTGPVREEDFKK